MKSMHLTFHRGKSAAKFGQRIVPLTCQSGSASAQDFDESSAWIRKGSSTLIRRFFESDFHIKRETWAQLTILIDEIELSFWLPEELDYVCEVFQMTPFPTALSLSNRDPNESRLNGHWLSRLPKKAKGKKFRERFVKYVNSAPKDLRRFRSFYAD